MKKLDIESSIFWLVISGYVCVRSTKLGLGNVHNPGPGFLFFWSGVVLGVLSIIVMCTSLRKMKEDAQDHEMPFGNVNWPKVISVIGSLMVYGLIIEWLGFLISTILLMGFLLSSIEAKKWYIVIGVSLATAFLSYALFELWLHTRLPKGILGI